LGSFADGSLSFLYVTYGLVAAVGLGLAIMMAPIAAFPRWFPERPGFAFGVAFLGFGMGPAANVPLMTGLLSATGGPLETFYFLGIIYAVLIGIAAWFVRYPLEDDGLAEGHPAEGGASVPDRSKMGEGTWVLRGALKTWQLYALWAVFFPQHYRRARHPLRSPANGRFDRRRLDRPRSRLRCHHLRHRRGGATRVACPLGQDGGRTTFLAMFSLQAMAFLLIPLWVPDRSSPFQSSP
jgi:hypothetical protein